MFSESILDFDPQCATFSDALSGLVDKLQKKDSTVG